jgi:hypothetical protein
MMATILWSSLLVFVGSAGSRLRVTPSSFAVRFVNLSLRRWFGGSLVRRLGRGWRWAGGA